MDICKKKMTEDRGVNEEVKRFVSKKKKKGECFKDCDMQHRDRHCNKAEDRLMHKTTDSPAFMLTGVPVNRQVHYV